MLIKTLEGDGAAVDRLEDTQSELRNKVVKRTKFSVFSNLVLNLGFSFGYLVAFAWAAFRLSAATLTFGGMTAFLQLVNRIQSPARQLTRLVPSFVSVFTAAERLMELEEKPLGRAGRFHHDGKERAASGSATSASVTTRPMETSSTTSHSTSIQAPALQS